MSEALAHVAMPVAVVAAAHGAERACSTGTLTYVSYSPPLVATSIRAASRTYSLLAASGQFSLSLLAGSQAELAVRAAAPSDGDKLAEQGIPVAEPPAGFAAPGVAGAVAVLWCALESASEAGSYVLCVGRVEEWRGGEGDPLLRFDRRYRSLGPGIDVAEEARYPL